MAFSDRFNKFFPFILSAECSFAKGHYGDLAFVVTERVRGDDGGDTYAGVDRASHPNFDFAAPTIEKAKEVYWSEWQGEGIESLASPFAEAFFDCAINCGLGRARKLEAQSGQDAKKFLDLRVQFYERLAAQVDHDRVFLKGWKARVADLERFLGI